MNWESIDLSVSICVEVRTRTNDTNTHTNNKKARHTHHASMVPAGSAAMSEALYLYTKGSTLSNGACIHRQCCVPPNKKKKSFTWFNIVGNYFEQKYCFLPVSRKHLSLVFEETRFYTPQTDDRLLLHDPRICQARKIDPWSVRSAWSVRFVWSVWSSSWCRAGAVKNVHDIGHVSWVGSVLLLYRSCAAPLNGRLGPITWVHSNQDPTCCVKIEAYTGFWVHRGSWLLITYAPPVNGTALAFLFLGQITWN